MRNALLLALFSPLVALAQPLDAASTQKLLDEMKAVRAILERVESAQRVMLALSRIQVDQNQLAIFEAQRAKVADREQDLAKELDRANRTIQSPPLILTADGTAQPAPVGEGSPVRARAAELSTTVKGLSRSREALEQEIARVKSRIAEMDELVEAAIR